MDDTLWSEEASIRNIVLLGANAQAKPTPIMASHFEENDLPRNCFCTQIAVILSGGVWQNAESSKEYRTGLGWRASRLVSIR
jgi:hypothetical protein